MNNKICLVILDGFGEGPDGPGNAIKNADTPHINQLRAKYPYGILQASGEAVGLVEGAMGGSEVGHFTMGAGRIVPQFLLSINKSIEDGSFYKKQPLVDAFNYVKKSSPSERLSGRAGKKLHLLGMISDKGVHSHIDHLVILLEWAKRDNIDNVYIHAVADGRDVEERSVKGFIKTIQKATERLKIGKIATLVGRYFAMDRDSNWDRTRVAYQLMTDGLGEPFSNPLEAVENAYRKDPELTDYYLPPFLLDNTGLVTEGDAIIFFNYRTDRTRQLTTAFTDPDFTEFPVSHGDVHFVCMGPYSEIAPVVFETEKVKNNLAQWLSKNAVKQLRIAETEKYAHVTYFFNSQIEHHVPLEDRVLVPSPKVPSYAQKPEMSASRVTEKVLEAMKSGEHPVIIVNYANADLVGHSGDYKAAVIAIEALDEAIGKLSTQAVESGYYLAITGDHGNAEDMLYPDGSQKPAHSNNPVIFLLIDPAGQIKSVRDGGLADVAPTLLKLIGLEVPPEMTGKPLV